MKLILIVFHSDKEDEIHEILNSKGITGFTTWGPVYGKGGQSAPRMGTQIWPGENHILMTTVSDEEARVLKDAFLKSEEAGRESGIKIFELAANTWL